MDGRVIWCIGMYASASTWLFNVVRQICAQAGQDVQTYFVAGTADMAAYGRPDATHIVKSHEVSNAASIEGLGRRAAKIFVTIRDPRDAVTSLMLYHGYDFPRALDYVNAAARLCLRFSADKRAILWPYESGFFEQPETVATIAAHLGITIDEAGISKIFKSMQRAAVEQHIARMPNLPGILQDRISGDRLDPQTHWHTHHAGRSGEMGRWKHMLDAEQLAAIEKKLDGCFKFV